MTVNQYSCFEMTLTGSDSMTVTLPDGRVIVIEPFDYQPVSVTYDDEGSETVSPVGTVATSDSPERRVRFFPTVTGVYSYEAGGLRGSFDCVPDGSHGYIGVSRRDPRYLAYSDGTPFLPIGINLAFISPVGKSDGKEFGLSGKYKFLGLRQYERWFRQCSANGVNLARVWLGHEYLNPDTEEAYKLDPVQFAKIDALVALAGRYGIKLKLTLEQFRYFDYVRVADSNSYADDVFRKFNKRLHSGERRCESPSEWLNEDIWRDAWIYKLRELAKRLSGNPTVMAVELWNEMNCLPREHLNEWNRTMLAECKALFPNQLVMNSLGSFDSDWGLSSYRDFCWESSDFVQLHRYLDQGAPYKVCRDSPMTLIMDGISSLRAVIPAASDRPLLVAETGAVNNCHSGPFRYYPADHNGILFCDLVYTPLFCGAVGCGNIWHWDDRYVEAKNLYPYYKPLAKLCEGIEFDREEFTPDVYEDGDVILLLLRGRSVTLGYLRNKTDSWQNVLRDLNEPVVISEAVPVRVDGKLSVIGIWQNENASVIYTDRLEIANLRHGVFLRFDK